MKKFLSMTLALALVVALAIPAFATSPIEGDGKGSDSLDITATYESLENKDGGNVYYVTIAWGSQTEGLSYTAGTTTYTWNGTKMQYEAGTAGEDAGWSGEATVTVTVTNQSNAGITATSSSSASYGLAIEADKATLDLGSAAVKDGNTSIEYTDTDSVGTAQKGDITFTISSNNSTTAWNGQGNVGTVTVTIAPAED